MRVHLGDGREFVEGAQRAYDAIFLDAYGAISVPAHLTTLEFLRAVRRITAPGGVVIANLLRPPLNPQYHSMVRTYQEAFDELYILEVYRSAGSILLALPRRRLLGHDEFVQLARNAVADKRLPFDLRDIVAHRFLYADRNDPHATILRDADIARRSAS